MTISMPNDEQQTEAVVTDGYENCDKDMLIKLLRARDAEAANANKKLERLEEDSKKKDKALQAKDQEIKALKDENEQLGKDIHNKETLISNIVIKNMGECKTVYEFFEKELNLGGGLVFYLARDIEEQWARMNQEHNEQLAMSWRQSRINNQSKSEKNKGELPFPKAPPSDEQDDDSGLVNATLEKTLDGLPDTYSPGEEDQPQEQSDAPPDTDGAKAKTESSSSSPGTANAGQKKDEKDKKKQRDLGKKPDDKERKQYFADQEEQRRNSGKSVCAIANDCINKVNKHRQKVQNKDTDKDQAEQAALPDKALTLDDMKGLEQLNVYASMDVQEGEDGNLILRKWCDSCGGTHEFKIKPSP